MLKIKFYNLKKIFKQIGKLKTEPVNYPSVFNSIKKMSLFFFLYLFVTGITTLIIIFSLNSSKETMVVPKVINAEFYKAYYSLNKLGFNVDIELQNFNNIHSGIVAYQSITEQKKVKKGRKIKLVISLGPKGTEGLEGTDGYDLNSHMIEFKLPDKYNTARLKILVTDNKDTDRTVFNDIISSSNKIQLPVKIYGHGIQKIYINDELFIEKDIE
ncbi:MAG: PASTA domain-containing protein [Spirochaetes bacterium]|nr:PASTA domain-containing protein [Spirochaetota bacterium]